MRRFMRIAIALLLVAASAATSDAQLAPRPANGIVPDSPGALVLESVGASVGSFIGIGAVMLLSDCGVDDLECEILTVGAAGLAGKWRAQ